MISLLVLMINFWFKSFRLKDFVKDSGALAIASIIEFFFEVIIVSILHELK